MGSRVDALADRVEQGAREFATFVASLSDRELQVVTPRDGRTVGVVAHHVAIAYPIEIELVRRLVSGEGITDVTLEQVAEFNAQHAKDHADTATTVTLELLRANSLAAAQYIRTLSDEQLDRASRISLNGDAPLTVQYFIEQHAIGHSYHHRASMRAGIAAANDRE